MGRPKNSTISRRKNISRTATHKCHRATNDCAPEEVKGSRNIEEYIEEYIEEACVWIGDDDDDELAENAQQNVSSNSSSIAVLDSEEENDIHPSDSLHFSMIISKGIASWYQSVADARASNKRPHQYRGDSRTSPLITYYSYSIRSGRFMHSYRAGLDGPQAAWACKKYRGHRTLPPAAIQEARAQV